MTVPLLSVMVGCCGFGCVVFESAIINTPLLMVVCALRYCDVAIAVAVAVAMSRDITAILSVMSVTHAGRFTDSVQLTARQCAADYV